ncbi:hypothetical protein [Burkholderia stagnalis]|uniref:hypothetical protein n=1 Tax=Burkholderia stagnalis TaxID=1503054 RepID=UPI00075C5FC9|nr:hypothetical protein [Burkholderia stagnalis]KVM86820.1 hypothetical protein WT05_12355 [Burkholderia stagnalis]
MPIYEAGQHVRLKNGRSGVIEGVDTETTPGGTTLHYRIAPTGTPPSPAVRVSAGDIAGIESYTSAAQKFRSVSGDKRTTGLWYSWGPAAYNVQWIDACTHGRLAQHAAGIPKATDNLVGAGLYLAREMWRSSVYATEDATLLIASLRDVPTVDDQDTAQWADLTANNPAITRQNLITEKSVLAPGHIPPYLWIYTTNGNFACLTASDNVRLTTDLGAIPETVLLAQLNKLAAVAYAPLIKQIAISPTLSAHARDALMKKAGTH